MRCVARLLASIDDVLAFRLAFAALLALAALEDRVLPRSATIAAAVAVVVGLNLIVRRRGTR